MAGHLTPPAQQKREHSQGAGLVLEKALPLLEIPAAGPFVGCSSKRHAAAFSPLSTQLSLP